MHMVMVQDDLHYFAAKASYMRYAMLPSQKAYSIIMLFQPKDVVESAPLP